MCVYLLVYTKKRDRELTETKSKVSELHWALSVEKNSRQAVIQDSEVHMCMCVCVCVCV